MGKLINLDNKRFGRLVVIRRDFKRQTELNTVQPYWKCRCDCGNTVIVCGKHLRSGDIKSCGCLYKDSLPKESVDLIKQHKKALVENTDLFRVADRKLLKNNTSGVKGVYFNKHQQKWVSELWFKGKKVLCKSFADKQDAINARKEAELKYFKPILEKYNYKETN